MPGPTSHKAEASSADKFHRIRRPGQASPVAGRKARSRSSRIRNPATRHKALYQPVVPGVWWFPSFFPAEENCPRDAAGIGIEAQSGTGGTYPETAAPDTRGMIRDSVVPASVVVGSDPNNPFVAAGSNLNNLFVAAGSNPSNLFVAALQPAVPATGRMPSEVAGTSGEGTIP